MAGIFARVIKQWLEEAVVNKLADSHHMQKAAVTAVGAAQEAQRLAAQAAKDPAAAASSLSAGAAALWEALQAEARKDLGGVGGARAPPALDEQRRAKSG